MENNDRLYEPMRVDPMPELKFCSPEKENQNACNEVENETIGFENIKRSPLADIKSYKRFKEGTKMENHPYIENFIEHLHTLNDEASKKLSPNPYGKDLSEEEKEKVIKEMVTKNICDKVSSFLEKVLIFTSPFTKPDEEVLLNSLIRIYGYLNKDEQKVLMKVYNEYMSEHAVGIANKSLAMTADNICESDTLTEYEKVIDKVLANPVTGFERCVAWLINNGSKNQNIRKELEKSCLRRLVDTRDNIFSDLKPQKAAWVCLVEAARSLEPKDAEELEGIYGKMCEALGFDREAYSMNTLFKTAKYHYGENEHLGSGNITIDDIPMTPAMQRAIEINKKLSEKDGLEEVRRELAELSELLSKLSEKVADMSAKVNTQIEKRKQNKF